jgi:DNA-binding NarL/FixJ family response regulator
MGNRDGGSFQAVAQDARQIMIRRGQSAEFIAAKRGVAAETVRTQIKAIMAKLGVSRQAELVVRLGEL